MERNVERLGEEQKGTSNLCLRAKQWWPFWVEIHKQFQQGEPSGEINLIQGVTECPYIYLEILQTPSTSNRLLFRCSGENTLWANRHDKRLNGRLGLSFSLLSLVKSWLLCTKFFLCQISLLCNRKFSLGLNSRWVVTIL